MGQKKSFFGRKVGIDDLTKEVMGKMDSGFRDMNKVTKRLQEVQNKLSKETNPEVRAVLQKEFDMLMRVNNQLLDGMDGGLFDKLDGEIEKEIEQLEKKQKKAAAKFEKKQQKVATRFRKKQQKAAAVFEKKQGKEIGKLIREQEEMFDAMDQQFEENMAAMDAFMGQIDGALGLDDQNSERKSRKEREADVMGKRNKKISQEHTIADLKSKIKELGKTIARSFGKGD